MFSPVLDDGCLVVVTGVNGYVGSYVAEKLLEKGYRVRGTVRNATRCLWLLDLFEEKYGKGKFELTVVEDMARDGAYDEAVKGASGIVHVASIVQPGPDPNLTIPPVLAGIRGILQSAIREKSMRRFVLTSSSVAVLEPTSLKQTVTVDMWNDRAVELAWAPPPFLESRGMDIYAASKVLGEKEMWSWVDREKPHFVANSVIPPVIFGKPLSTKHQGYPSTSAIPVTILENDKAAMAAFIDQFPPFFFVDVEDVARLHVAGLIHPEVMNERLFAFAGPFNRNDILAILRQLFPKRELAPEAPGLVTNESEIKPAERSEKLLQGMWGTGFRSLEITVKANVENYLGK
ncbi:aldehyde reductase II [Aspergillus welwitschiae]|uniref:Aldehyde reductase II n=1 Tax=Aspergillus welwitschiae TaxID=1341132 RepID=A0A3F3QA02_9EURO|nr:aldehyde reductase II [Aspergillus welwitschiae]RDH36034.1 aldehyde reductase II [Aspergillus welwitschiae]